MQHGNVFVDHVFMLVDAGEVNSMVESLAQLRVEESSRRSHAGLGTSNIFFCFDNAFLEILWIDDRKEAAQSVLGRQLVARLEGRGRGATPFGIGFRTRNPDDSLPFDTWNFLPPGASGLKPVAIARSSEDPAQPLLFRAQRVLRPDQWVDGKAGARQTQAGIAEMVALRFSSPKGRDCSADLKRLRDLGLLSLGDGEDEAQMTLRASYADGRPSFEIPLRRSLQREPRS
jgi:hypothetical protein